MLSPTSPRERRLWLWAVAVLVAIYASLGWARPVAGWLRDAGLLEVTVSVVALAVVAGLVVPWFRSRPRWPELATAAGILFAFALVFIRIENPAERTHLIEYAVLAALIHQALLERVASGGRVPHPATVTVAMTAGLGLLDELIQALIPTRVFDWWDVLFNALAGFGMVTARLAIRPVQRPGWRLWMLWVLAAGFGWGWFMDPSVFGDGEFYVAALPFRIPRPMSVAVGGVAVGILQAMVLRTYVPRAWRWALLTAIPSAAIALLFGWAGGNAWAAAAGGNAWAVAAGAYGFILAAIQWSILGDAVRGRWLWVLVCGLAWLLVIPLGDATGPPGWANHGAMTGAVLVWLLRRGSETVD